MSETLAAALEREHHEIDGGIAAFVADPRAGEKPLRTAMDALRRHIYLEEVLVFPRLREAGMMAPVFVMLREHGEMWQVLDRMEDTEDPDRLSAQCAELVPMVEAHNGKEEPILYPQVDTVLDEDESAVLREFLESGTMPEGWTCEQSAGGPRRLPF